MIMGDLSRHFNRNEFSCKCGCGKDTIDFELVMVLEHIRSHFNTPVYINSGARCVTHNKLIGGSRNSQHVKCKAADIAVKNHSPAEVYDFLESEYPDKYGLGLYDGFVHVDVRRGKARWSTIG